MARQEVIDGTVPEETQVTVYEMPKLDDSLEVDFIDSDDLEAIEDGIRTIERTANSLALVQGIAILKAEELWEQSGLGSIQEYRQEANVRYGMSRGAVSQRRKMAYAWQDNIKSLRGIRMDNKSTHLLYLSDAMARHPKREVIDAFKKMTSREFRDFATGTTGKAYPNRQDVSVTVSRGQIALDGQTLLHLDEELDEEERDFIGKGIKALYRAREGNMVPHVVAVYDPGEARAVDNFLKKLRSSK